MSRLDPIHCVAASVLGCVFMLGCSAASDDGTTGTGAHPAMPGIDYNGFFTTAFGNNYALHYLFWD